MGETDEARAAFEKDDDEAYRVKGQVLCAYARGDQETFEKHLAVLRERWGDQWPSEIAHVYAWTGDPDAAFEWLDKAVAIDEEGIGTSRRNMLLNPLHQDPAGGPAWKNCSSAMPSWRASGSRSNYPSEVVERKFQVRSGLTPCNRRFA